MKKKFYSDMDRLRNMKDEDIDLTDCPELDEEFFKNAKAFIWPEHLDVKPSPASAKKEPVPILIDRDVLEWFQAQGEDYQERINAVLRFYMEAQRD